MDNITVKGANYNYAPGLATYAVDGIQGEQGLNGNNIFYTNILIKNELSIILNQIKNNYYPLKNNTTLVNRPYQNNDLFFDNAGTIWQLINYDDLTNDTISGLYSKYFKIVGQITLDQSKYIDRVDQTGRIILDPSNYSGFDIVLGDLDPATVINEEMPINVASNIIDENNNISFLIFQAIQSGIQENGNMQIYFDTNTKSFHVDTKNTLFVDTDVLIADSSNEPEYDNYSRILTDSDSITSFKNLCDKFVYEITMDTSACNYVEISVKDDTLSNDEKVNLLNKLVCKDNLYLKLYDNSVNQYVVYLDTNIKKYNTNEPYIHKISFTPSSQEALGVTNYLVNYNNVSHLRAEVVGMYKMNYFYDISDSSAFIKIENGAPASLKQPGIATGELTVAAGIFKSIRSKKSAPSFYRMVPFYMGSEPEVAVLRTKYFYKFEFEAYHYMINDGVLGIQCTYNIGEITNEIVTIPLINLRDIPGISSNKRYILYYDRIGYSQPGTGSAAYDYTLINVTLLTDTFKITGSIDPNNPVISTEIPGDINNIAKVGLLYNTEVFLQPK